MSDDRVRDAVREALARHLAARGTAPPASVRQAAFALFVLPADGGGACLIEPAVACTHCGYCQSYGH